MTTENSTAPIMRAMPLVFPEDQSAWSYDEQYMLGDSLLVIPVINPEQRAHYYLPPGDWYHLSTGEKFTGPLTVKQDIPLEYIPVFGRAGYILPLGPEVQHTDELKPGVDLEEIWVFGDMQHGINLPRLTIRIDADGQIQGVPDGVKIKHW